MAYPRSPSAATAVYQVVRACDEQTSGLWVSPRRAVCSAAPIGRLTPRMRLLCSVAALDVPVGTAAARTAEGTRERLSSSPRRIGPQTVKRQRSSRVPRHQHDR